jgi:hypothetical protein
MRTNHDEAMPDFDCPVHDQLGQRRPAMLTTGVDSAASTPLVTVPATTTRLPGVSSPDDRAFSDLLGAFCCHVGLANGNEVAERLRRRMGPSSADLVPGFGTIVLATSVLGGLYHEYRIAVAPAGA